MSQRGIADVMGCSRNTVSAVFTAADTAGIGFEQVADLNRRHGSPLRDKAEVARYFRLVSGHPYLVRRGLYEMAGHHLEIATFEALRATLAK